MQIKRHGGWVAAAALGAGLFAGAAIMAAPAHACGGLFCSSAQPVNQAAERIVFSFDQTKKQVTAVVEILYSGPAEKFAWVLPVPGVPAVGVSTSAVLDRLQAITNPTYSIQRTWPDNSCRNNTPGGSGAVADASPSPRPPAAPETGGVAVLASGSVGPYNYDVIMVDPDPAVTDKAMVALEWLMKNGYDTGALGREVLQPYLRDGLNLIAFKLQKNQSAGSIRPVMLTYSTEHPMIPIVPTKVAANPDMGILVFVLGDKRAVPINYKSLELNEALINWFSPNTTYNTVVTAAADEAKGQGFVTEMAGATSQSLWSSLYSDQGTFSEYRRTADGLGTVDLLKFVIQRFSSVAQGGFMGPFASRPSGMRVVLDGVTDVLTANLTLPPGVTVAQLMARPNCYLTPPTPGAVYCEGLLAPTEQEHIDLKNFDRRKFMLAVEDLVIKPIEATAQLFLDQPYLTRLYTTLSPAEMTVDPTFDLLAGLPTVSNAHTVTLAYSAGCFDPSGPWTASIGGLMVRGMGNVWPHDLKAATMPFNRRILQMTSGQPPTVEVDNTNVIAKALGVAPPASTADGGVSPPVDGGPAAGDGTKSGGCSVGDVGAAGPFTLISLLGAAILWRRRRR